MAHEPLPWSFSKARVSQRRLPHGTQAVGFIMGAACCGQLHDGPQTAPGLILTDQYHDFITSLGWSVAVLHAPQQFRPTRADSTAKQSNCVSATCDLVREKVKEALMRKSLAVLIGGDHCLAIGSIAAAAEVHPDLCVLWFDAHADINTPVTSPSKNMHGMPVAALLGLRDMESAEGFEAARFKAFDKNRIAYIGLRDVDQGEKDTIAELGIQTAFYMNDLNDVGIDALLDRCLQAIDPAGVRPIHISFDVDGMDPMDAPATGTPVVRGVRLHEAIHMLRRVRDTGRMVSIDVVEVNPSLATTPLEYEITIANARLVIAEALGRAPPAATSGTSP